MGVVPGLPVRDHSSPTGQCHRYHKHLPCLNWLPKTTQHLKPTQKLLPHQITFCTKKRLYKDWGARRTLQGLKEFSKVGVLVSTIVYILFHLQRVDRGSIHLLWLTCKVAGSMFPDTWPGSISVPNKRSKQDQQRITTHALPSYLEPPQVGKSVSQVALGTHSIPIHLPKPLGIYSLHRGHFYIRPFSQYWERYLFYLIHKNKHRKSNKMNISQMKE